MKTKNFWVTLKENVCVINLVIWVFLGIVSFICAPKAEKSLFGKADFTSVEVAYQQAPDVLKPLVKATWPMAVLIDPAYTIDAEGWLWVGIELSALLFFFIYLAIHFEAEKNKKRRVLEVFDFILMLYLLLCLAVLISGCCIELSMT